MQGKREQGTVVRRLLSTNLCRDEDVEFRDESSELRGSGVKMP